jgi:S-DNA-T family DNA segregation ATPase FtsK/SpoIIIE
MSKRIDCTECLGMGKKLVKKAGRVTMVVCKPCKGKGQIVVESSSKAAKKSVKVVAKKLAKPSTKRTDRRTGKPDGIKSTVRAHKDGVVVTTRDLETGQDVVTGRLTEEQREARGTIEDRAAFFGCPGKVTEIRKGPVITLFEFKPAKTTRVKRLINLQEDLALALSAEAVMVRRIPGKEAMGIEISNDEGDRQSVGFRASLSAVRAAKKAGMELPLNLGIDPFGEPVIDDLAAMPHLLIAGSTGSGKSVSLNCIISSLLTVCPPEELEFYMIDPKGVELSHYNGIPHMKREMVTSPHYAKDLLEDLIEVMRARLILLGQKRVRDIREYNAVVEPAQKLPRIVCVIDELGDLMMQDRRGFTRFIAEISGMARATGIHMVCATHRPSVDVLSGKVKVNFPARMAFRVTSAVDSKVIIHRKGAEGLLGRGDMMYLSPTRSTTIRIHAPWVPLSDVKVIADRLREVEAERKAKEEKERMAAEEKRLAELRKVQHTMAEDARAIPGGFGVRRTVPMGEAENLEIDFGYGLGTTQPKGKK